MTSGPHAANGALNTPTVNFGVVLKKLEQYRDLVHLISRSSLVGMTEHSYAAPIYKGSEGIRAGLAASSTALEKFDVYFSNAILDEQERVRFAHLFMAAYVKRYPASERTDLFLASGDVLRFSFELVPPAALENPELALQAIERTPHDTQVVRALRASGALDRAHLRAEVKIFLDHILNPRRREMPEVQKAMRELGTDLPYIAELVTNGAVPGYLYYVLRPLVEEVGGRLVFIGG
jgi:hypothetical protein